MLRIDNDYWKRKQDEINKQRLMQTLQSRLAKPSSSGKSDQKHQSGQQKENSSSSQNASHSQWHSHSKKKHSGKHQNSGKSGASSSSAPASGSSKPASAPASHLGPDGKLTAAERQHRVDQGLCLLCGQKGHVIRDCPKSTRSAPANSSSSNTKARAAKAEPEAGPSQPKK